MRAVVTALILACAPPLCAAQAQSNEVISRLVAEDQADRMAVPDKMPWTEMAARDKDRRAKTLEILQQGLLRTEADYQNAALIFQHGDMAEDIQLAFALATIALRIDPGSRGAKWLSAAAFDRLMMRHNRPQWYGTQYRRSAETGKWFLYEVDESAVTDAQRKALNVPSLDDAKAQLQKMNP